METDSKTPTSPNSKTEQLKTAAEYFKTASLENLIKWFEEHPSLLIREQDGDNIKTQQEVSEIRTQFEQKLFEQLKTVSEEEHENFSQQFLKLPEGTDLKKEILREIEERLKGARKIKTVMTQKNQALLGSFFL